MMQIYSHESIFIVPFSAKFWCILKAWNSMCGSWPMPFLRHSNSARSR